MGKQNHQIVLFHAVFSPNKFYFFGGRVGGKSSQGRLEGGEMFLGTEGGQNILMPMYYCMLFAVAKPPYRNLNGLKVKLKYKICRSINDYPL